MLNAKSKRRNEQSHLWNCPIYQTSHQAIFSNSGLVGDFFFWKHHLLIPHVKAKSKRRNEQSYLSNCPICQTSNFARLIRIRRCECAVTFVTEHLVRRTMRKRVFGHMRTAKTQISLRIRAVWSGPSLSANGIIGYYRMYECRAKARILLCACAGWSEYAHFAHIQSYVFGQIQ